MKVLLVTPPTSSKIYGKFEASAPNYPPLGLCYLAAVLERVNHTVEILDCQVSAIDQRRFREELIARRPDVVGFTATTVQYNSAAEAARTVKLVDPEILTVIGGAHLSAMMEDVLAEEPALDVGVYGEGEITTLRLLGRVGAGKPLSGIRGLLYRDGARVIRTDPRPPIKDIDCLPLPARHLLRSLRDYTPPMTRKTGRITASVITSRGCPMQCAFCDQAIFGRTWRGHSAEYVIAELRHLKIVYGVDSVTFEDDFFSCSKARVVDISQQMIAADLQLKWGCSVRCDSINDDVLEIMKQAGCKYVYVGIESGTERILEMVNKGTSLESISRGIRLIKKHGLQVIGSAVVGFPTETVEEIERTIAFVLSLPIDGLSFFLFTPYPNTKTHEMARETGTLRTDWDLYSAHPHTLAYIPEGVPESYLSNLQRRVYLRFYTRPRFILSHLGDFLQPDFVIRATKSLFAGFFS